MTSEDPRFNQGPSRRRVLAAGLSLGALSALPSCATPAIRTAAKPATGKAKNIIFMVSDGMSTGTLTLAEMFRDIRGKGAGAWRSLWSRPGCVRSVTQTYSASGYVTDSAAAGSAWGIGEHIENGAVNVTPDGRSPEPVLVTAKKNGFQTGLVTTTRVTHATPAAFIANAPRRSMEADIARQMLERRVDVILGGGAKHFDEGLLQRHSNVTLVRDKNTLAGAMAGGAPVLGLFNEDHMSYVPDRRPNEPTLAEMTHLTLDRFARAGDRFVVQIEAGRVDHAAHANDAFALVEDQLEFDAAVGVAAEFAASRDDTLLIVTTDHGNANPGLTLYGAPGIRALEKLTNAKRSMEWVSAQMGPGRDLIELIQQAAGVELKAHEADWIRRGVIEREPVDPFGPANEPGPVIGSVLANHFGVAFVSPNHTADLVELTAIGPGSERIPPYTDNIDLYGLMFDATGMNRPRS